MKKAIKLNGLFQLLVSIFILNHSFAQGINQIRSGKEFTKSELYQWLDNSIFKTKYVTKSQTQTAISRLDDATIQQLNTDLIYMIKGQLDDQKDTGPVNMLYRELCKEYGVITNDNFSNWICVYYFLNVFDLQAAKKSNNNKIVDEFYNGKNKNEENTSDESTNSYSGYIRSTQSALTIIGRELTPSNFLLEEYNDPEYMKYYEGEALGHTSTYDEDPSGDPKNAIRFRIKKALGDNENPLTGDVWLEYFNAKAKFKSLLSKLIKSKARLKIGVIWDGGHHVGVWKVAYIKVNGAY